MFFAHQQLSLKKTKSQQITVEWGLDPEGSIISDWETQFAWISPIPFPPQKKHQHSLYFSDYLLLSNMTLLSSLRDRLSTCLCHQSIAIWIKGNEARTNPSENVVEANQRHAQHFFLFQFAKQKIKGKQEHEYLLSMYTEGCIYIHIIDIFINIINHNMWLM